MCPVQDLDEWVYTLTVPGSHQVEDLLAVLAVEVAFALSFATEVLEHAVGSVVCHAAPPCSASLASCSLWVRSRILSSAAKVPLRRFCMAVGTPTSAGVLKVGC